MDRFWLKQIFRRGIVFQTHHIFPSQGFFSCSFYYYYYFWHFSGLTGFTNRFARRLHCLACALNFEIIIFHKQLMFVDKPQGYKPSPDVLRDFDKVVFWCTLQFAGLFLNISMIWLLHQTMWLSFAIHFYRNITNLE